MRLATKEEWCLLFVNSSFQDALPIVLDLEFGGNCKDEPNFESLLREINSFLAIVKTKFPGVPIFYVTQEFYKHYMSGRLGEFPHHYLWFRDIFTEPTQQNCEKWKIWQFTNRGRVSGVAGAVDLNVFCGNEIDFKQLFGP